MARARARLATYDGEIIFHSASGALLPQKLVIPKLSVHKARAQAGPARAARPRRCAHALLTWQGLTRVTLPQDWHVGLSADPLDHSHPDVGDAPRAEGAAGAGGGGGGRRRRLLQVEGEAGAAGAAGGDGAGAVVDEAEPATSDAAAGESFERFRADDETWEEGLGEAGAQGGAFPSDDGYAYEGPGAEFDAAGGIHPPREYAHEGAYDAPRAAPRRGADADAADDDALNADAAALAAGQAARAARATPGSSDDGGGGDAYSSSDYGGGWGAQEWDPSSREGGAEAFWKDPGEGMIDIDAHVLCSPTLADLDGDGTPELLVAVSYFFDKEVRGRGGDEGGRRSACAQQPLGPPADALLPRARPQRYSSPGARAHLPADVSLSNYLGTGLVVFDLARLRLKWQVHLDLSTDAATFRAYAYSAPAAADADGDGRLEVYVGTSVGFVYAFDPSGALRMGYPLQMGEVQAGVALADLDGDGALELLAADTRGNVAAFDAATGREKWERHLASMAAQSATFADVNADGTLDVILPTADGRVHVLHGGTGADVAPFPFHTRGRVMAPVTPVPAPPGAPRTMPPVTLIAASFDGFVYFINGLIGCAEPVDIGETVYGAPLLDDVDGDGLSEVVVATMNGNVVCLATPWPHHALMTWPAAPPGGSNPSARAGWAGVHVTPASRRAGDASGDAFAVQFTVEDARPGAQRAAERVAARRRGAAAAAASASEFADAAALRDVGPYEVTVTLRVPGRPPSVTAATYRVPGTYSLTLPVPPVRARGAVTVQLRDAYGLLSADSYSVAFHARYYRLLKWLLVGPFTAMALAIAAGLGDALPPGGVGGGSGAGGGMGGGGGAPWGARARDD